MSNSFGRLFRVTTFGESHGAGIGVVIDGCPAGLSIDEGRIAQELARRRPGQSRITTQRQESEAFEIFSGIYDGKSTGMPIALFIRNSNARSKDYDHLKDTFRPSHADFTYEEKYGHRDHRGGGRSSARETAARVAAGAIAQQWLEQQGIEIFAYVSQVGNLVLDKSHTEIDRAEIENNIVRCPDPEMAQQMEDFINEVRLDRDTVGGVVTGVIRGLSAGLGEPVFDRLHARLAYAMMGINAAKGFEYGSGFKGVEMRGSTHNDKFYVEDGKVKTETNFSGGIQGGISNGEDIYFRVAFKPVATIMKDQDTINKEGEGAVVAGKGRHDPCVVPRAVPIVEAMSALVIADFILISRTNKAF